MEDAKDVSVIQDEDVLRRMWQATEDFSKKKEIRAHMYKLREARLKEFYTSGDVLKDVQRSNSSPGLREQQPCAKAEGPTHADSLADHSFLSLKTKEIRDSESPTRDVQYRNSKNRDTDGQWTITSKTSKSDDGKTITSSQLATTQGVRALEGGQLAYAAANEHQASVFADGDANNFTKSVGESSKTFAHEDVVTGDDNNYRSSKTTSSSSNSQVVTHHSSTGDFDAGVKTIYLEAPEEYVINTKSEKISSENVGKSSKLQDGKSSTTVTKTTYTSGEIPDDLKKSIADGNTKVYTETKTLPDGSTVTTTRYETKGSKKWNSTSGTTQMTSNRQVSSTDNRINKQIISGDDDTSRTLVTTKTIREIYDEDDGRPTNRNDINKTESVRIIESEKQVYGDDVTNVYNESKVTRKTKDIREDITEQDRNVIREQDVVKVTRTITEDQLPREPETKEIETIVTTTETVIEEPIRYVKSTPEPEMPSPTRARPQKRPQGHPPQESVKSCKPEQTYRPSSPTEGQYSTTYRSEFTNKRISVDVSATHDAFARSLRSISPDRISDRPKSRGSMSSIRSSTSPEKQPRMSPERKPGYEKCPDQRKHTTSPERKSPERKPLRPDSITITKTTDTISKRKPTEKKSPTKASSPTKSDVTITKTTKVTKAQTTPTKSIERTSPIRSPTKDISPVITDTVTRKKKVPDDVERKSPVRSPTKSTTTEITSVNTDTTTKKKKHPEDDDERKSPVRSPTKSTTTEITTVNTDTITRKKKHPEDDDARKSPLRSPTKSTTTDITTVYTDTTTRKTKFPEDDDESKSPVCSPNKSTTTEITTVNTDTITRKKKQPEDDDERKSPIRSPTKSTTTDMITVNTDILTRKKKRPEDDDERKSPLRSPTKSTTEITTVNTDTLTRKKKLPEDDDERKSPVRSPTKSTTTEITTVNTDTITRKKKQPEDDDERKSPVRSPTKSTTTDISTVNTDTITKKKQLPEDDLRSPIKSTTAVTEITSVNTDTLTKKKKKSPVDDAPEEHKPSGRSPSKSGIPTKKKPQEIEFETTEVITEKSTRPTSRDLSPTSLASDIEFINHNRHIVTDLDEPCDVLEKRPTTLAVTETVTTKTTKQTMESPKQPSSPIKQKSPTKSSPVKSPTKEKSPVKESPKKVKPSAPEFKSPSTILDDHFEQVCEIVPSDLKDKPPLKRTETYEERCRQMLGLPEPDKIPKKEYDELYAGMEPVEEPLIIKKHVTPLGPIGVEDELMMKSIQKLHDRRAQQPEEDKIPTIEDMIISERKDTLESTVRKPSEKKKPQKPKKQPDDDEYNTEYTDEYCDRSPQKDKKPTSKASSPERKITLKKQPKDIEPTEGGYTTEYVDEYCDRPQRTTTVVDKKSRSPDRKPSRESPERKPMKKQPDNQEFTTEYIDEYSENITATKIPTSKPKRPNNDISPVRGIASSPTKTKSPVNKKKPKTPKDDTTDEEEVDEYSTTTTEVTTTTDTKKIRKLPENTSVTEYINEYPETPETNDFINREKYDTNITLAGTESPERQPRKLIDIQFDIENENTQERHFRTHRIDTTVTSEIPETLEKPRETSPRRQPQRAVPSDTMECTFKRTIEEDERVTSPKKKPEEPKSTKKPQKPLGTDDRKSPVKQIKDRKDSVPKTSTTSKVVTKKVYSTDIDKRETPKKKIPAERIPKDKSPERYERAKPRSPSPATRITTRKIVENQVIRKTSCKDLPLKKAPERPSKQLPSSRTPSESPIRKPLQSSPASSPERKPQKPISKSSPTQSSKHVVTKTISLTSRPDTKPQPSSPVKTIPKTVTTIKTTKVNQPSLYTVKTTKTTKKSIKPKKPDDSSESDSESEIINVTESRTDRKKVVTTAKIKINHVNKQPSPSRSHPKEPNVTIPTFKVNTTEVTTITDHQPSTTKCITTKSIVLNQSQLEDIEFVIDLQRSTSSREASPEKICPIPVSSEDEGGYPRYPDKVSEPDDVPSRRKPMKISDIPLTEGEDVRDFNRIIDITEISRKPIRITDSDRVTDTDESLLSVTEKVSKFITTAEKLTDDEPKYRKPAPRVPRPELVVDGTLEDDECLLSVSDKVSKFITTAEQVSVNPSERPRSPKPRERTPVDIKVNENDECLLSVNQKVSHFIQAAETVKHKPATKEGPAPKVNRPEFTVDDTLKTDECLLSVSDKVNKFLTTAEKLTTPKTEVTVKREPSPEKRSPRREYSPEKTIPRRDSPEKVIPKRESPEKIIRTEVTPSPEKPCSRQSPVRKIPETITVRKTPETSHPKSESSKPFEAKPEIKPVHLKSSEAVRKAKAMFENISKTDEVPKQRDILSRPSIWEGRKKPEKPEDTEEVKLTDIGVYKKKEPEVKKQLIYSSEEDDSCRRISTNLKDVTLKSTKLILNENRYLSPEKDIPGYMKPIQKPSTVTREEVTVEKRIQRSRSPNPEIPGYMRPIPKLSPEDETRSIQRSRSPNPNGDVPGYMRPIPKITPEEREKYIREARLRETVTPERYIPVPVQKKVEREEIEIHKIRNYENGDIPHYMLPLQRNLTPERDTHKKTYKDEELEIVETFTEKSRSPERDIPGYMKPLQRHAHSPDREDVTEDGPKAGKKFGVTLRRTDSGRVITTNVVTTVTERRRSSTPGQPVIEDIQDLEVLERMMDKVIGYEQRRRIRAQIRVVKKVISDNKAQKRIRKVVSPSRETPVSKSSPSPCDTAPYDRRSPIRDTKRSSVSPVKKSPENLHKSSEPRTKSSPVDSKTSISTVTTTTQKSERVVTSSSSKERSVSPEPKKRGPPASQMYKPDLKHVQHTTKVVQEEKPSWVTNRNLKKTTAETVTEKRVVIPGKKVETSRRSPSPQKDAKPIDCITSSYGIGPTDEHGQPLFGIKALRKATDNSKIHVRGTVVTSQFYSENGEEPVGEVTVTKYSNDPRELDVEDEQINKSKGLAAVTTTQKFGTRGSPTLSSIVDKKKAITEKSEEDEIFKTTSSKVTRRGSVKALSQKFIENAGTQRSGKINLESITSDIQSKNSTATSTKTFLNSHTRVADAQEVITRMKNAELEHQQDDSPEDREARMLLNKFLGAQVLMSGMEPLLGTQSSVTTSSTATASAQMVRKVQKTKTTTSTTKESSKPVSLTKRFQTPITAEVLQDIWDEQTLRALLEQCTDYEERRAIRARLRQVMAEQEAVANVVANAVSETGDRTMQERTEMTKKTFSEGPVTTTQVSTTRVIQSSKQVSKPISPFAKFRQLDKQNSLNTPPSSPRTPTGTGALLFKFTDPALSQSASTVKDRLLHWCQIKTKEYQNIKLENFSTSWVDGMGFCALIHHFLPDAFDYHALNPKQRRYNFTLAFKVADEQAGIAPLLDVDDMVAMRRPDWKCVFTYVQSIYRRFKDED